jgi:hypothetical protein
MRHLAVGGIFDYVTLGLERPNSEQSIVIHGLLVWRDAKPNMVRIESRHDYISLANGTLGAESISCKFDFRTFCWHGKLPLCRLLFNCLDEITDFFKSRSLINFAKTRRKSDIPTTLP